MNGARLLLRMASASMRAQAQYPLSALMLTTGHFLVTLVEIGAAWALFRRFGTVRGFEFGEVALLFGLVNIQFAIADVLTRGFDLLGQELVRTGAFDRLLLRPRSLALQLAGHDVRVSRAGRLLTGVLALAWATDALPLQWTPGRLALAAWAAAGGVALFCGIVVLQGTLSFWTVQGLEIGNAFGYGGVEAGQFPMPLYERWFRAVLTYAVPIACVTYYPVVTLLGREDPLGAPAWAGLVAPAAGPAFLLVALLAWRAGVRRYVSTGT